MRIPLVRGRGFTEREAEGAPAVALINETMARRVFPGEDPLGKRVVIDYMERRVPLEIVGVVADTKQWTAEAPRIQIYDCYLQRPWLSSSLVLRTEGDPAALAPAAQRAVREVDASRAASNVKTMEQLLSASVAQPRFYAQLLTAFAAVALLLAAVGVYGVISYGVSQRTQEIGIRVALGAGDGNVLRLVVGHAAQLTGVGLLLGLTGALALSRVIAGQLFQVSPTDPPTLATGIVLLAFVAVLAAALPARRAARVDPAVALRAE
jgi:putative ABC transport system permease protein